MSEKSSILGQIFSSKILRGGYSDERCELDFPMKGTDQEKRRLTYLVNTISRSSEIGKAVLSDAAKAGFELSFEMQPGTCGYCGRDEETKKPHIVLNPTLSDNELITTLAHEARHAQQDTRGCTYEFGDCTPKSEIMLYRAMEADAQATSLMTCLDIREKTGNAGPLNKFRSESSIIANKIPREILNNKIPFKPTNVLYQQAFDGWYEDGKMMYAYENAYISRPMARYREKESFSEHPYDKKLTSAQIVSMVCVNADGKSYWENKQNVLETPDKLKINSSTAEYMKAFFGHRQHKTGQAPDPELKTIPIEKCFGLTTMNEAMGFSQDFFKKSLLLKKKTQQR
ncbi:MAG: hypothetical protein MJ250_06160 [Alphaproteobacteria bacterium]|nr:hypothetical protein [Alphaproteobacteria bacterium]